MTRLYTLSNGACAEFDDNDFDYILKCDCDVHDYKRLKTFHWWFDCVTGEEVADPEFRRSLDLRCIDANPQCYKNLAFPGYEFISKAGRRNGKLMKNTELSHISAIFKIIVNGKTTIVLWEDGTKTIVRPSAKDNYDLEAAVCAAIAKKIYGTNSAFKRMIREKTVVQENKKNEENNQFLKTLRDFLNCTKPSFSTYLGSVSTKGEE